MKKVVYSPEAPEPVGPYSQAIEVDGWFFCSGQIALNAKTGEVLKGDVRDQTKLVMTNIEKVLSAAKLDFQNVVKTTIFLTDMNDFQTVNQIYAEYFPKDPPARSTVAVKTLPKGVQVEVEVLARRF